MATDRHTRPPRRLIPNADGASVNADRVSKIVL
jgi:hypothetical protein